MTTIEETLEFYNHPLAFNLAKAKLALEEKGLKVRTMILKQRLWWQEDSFFPLLKCCSFSIFWISSEIQCDIFQNIYRFVLLMQYTEKRIDILNGQSLEPWYMKLNPHCWSPTLVTEKEILMESLDIIK